jgi:hypothetical protein
MARDNQDRLLVEIFPGDFNVEGSFRCKKDSVLLDLQFLLSANFSPTFFCIGTSG